MYKATEMKYSENIVEFRAGKTNMDIQHRIIIYRQM